MYPRLFSIETPEFLRSILPDVLSIYSYGFFIALGVVICFIIARAKFRKFGLDSDDIASLFTSVIAAAFLGGKLFYFLQDPSKYISKPSLIMQTMSSGFVFYGSLIFAIPTIIWWLKKRKIEIRSFLDILAFIGPIIHSMGRLGCFMAGCCYGKVCHSPIGVKFTHPESLAKPINIPLYPTQLFDIFVNMLILGIVLLFNKKKQFNGQLFLIYLMIYAVGRSIVEIYRGDSERGFIFGQFSHSQFIALIIILVCSYLWSRWKSNPKV